MEWKPIETAPKDGTWIMAWRGSAMVGCMEPLVFVSWLDGIWCWPDDVEDIYDDPFGVWERMDATGDFFHSNEFTHWMPLPAAPESKK